MGKQIKKEEVFQALVENAIEFIENSFNQIESNTKRSIINFWTGIELIFKARLVKEHWSLLFSNVNKADINDLNKGELITVNFEQNVDRIKKICNDNINNKSIEKLEKIKEHRNKLIHFVHKEIDSENRKLINEVVIEFCQGWFELVNLIDNVWEDHFYSYKKEIVKLEELLKSNTVKYLKVKFDKVRDVISGKKESGIKFIECQYCGYESIELTNEKLFNSLKCVVCEAEKEALVHECLDCSEMNVINPNKINECDNCGKEFSIDDLIHKYYTPYDRDRVELDKLAYCRECFIHHKSVIKHPDNSDKYICFNCFETFDHLDQCEYCCEYNTGILEASYLDGCSSCQGKLNE